MKEYATVIEAWFDAEDDEEAMTTAKRLGEHVLIHDTVRQVEVSAPEPME